MYLGKRTLTDSIVDQDLENDLDLIPGHDFRKKMHFNPEIHMKDGCKAHVLKKREMHSVEKTTKSALKHCPWKWQPCSEDVLAYLNNTPDYSKDFTKKTEFRIETSDNFLFNNKTGWSWHKTRALPEIIVRRASSEQEQVNHMKLKVELCAVIFLYTKKELPNLKIMPLKGDTVKTLRSQEVSFNKIRFGTTSYRNKGLGFNLLVKVMACNSSSSKDREKSKDNREGENHVLQAYLSPAIYVDSVDLNDQGMDLRRKKICLGYFKLFNPKYLAKDFVKKTTSPNGEVSHHHILNDFQSMLHYISAVNIKKKTRHPIFLSIKFSSCFKIHYNTTYFTHSENIRRDIIFRFQSILNELEMKPKARSDGKPIKILHDINEASDKSFIIHIDMREDTNIH